MHAGPPRRVTRLVLAAGEERPVERWLERRRAAAADQGGRGPSQRTEIQTQSSLRRVQLVQGCVLLHFTWRVSAERGCQPRADLALMTGYAADLFGGRHCTNVETRQALRRSDSTPIRR